MEPITVYGLHPIEEAIKRHPKLARTLFMKERLEAGDALLRAAKRAGIPVEILGEREFSKRFGFAASQGAALSIALPPLLDFDVWLKNLNTDNNPAVVILDELTDPGNVGAIIRSAASFGVSAVLLPKHNQAQVTGTVYKTSAGTAATLPLVQLGNVNTAVKKLKERGFWIYGLSESADKEVSKEAFTTPAAFIVGNEDHGIRQKTKEACDFLLKIPMAPGIDSLNASVSAAVLMYEWRRGRK